MANDKFLKQILLQKIYDKFLEKKNLDNEISWNEAKLCIRFTRFTLSDFYKLINKMEEFRMIERRNKSTIKLIIKEERVFED